MLCIRIFFVGSGVDNLAIARAEEQRSDPNASVLNLGAPGIKELDTYETASRIGKQLHGHGLEALGRRQLDVVVQEQDELAMSPEPRDGIVIELREVEWAVMIDNLVSCGPRLEGPRS